MEKYGVFIEPVEQTAEMIDWSNIVLATGSTVINNTTGPFSGTSRSYFTGFR